MTHHDRTIHAAIDDLAFGRVGYCHECGVMKGGRQGHSPECPARIAHEAVAMLADGARAASGRTQYDPAAEAFARARAKAEAICARNAELAEKVARERGSSGDWPLGVGPTNATAHRMDAQAIAAMEDDR